MVDQGCPRTETCCPQYTFDQAENQQRTADPLVDLDVAYATALIAAVLLGVGFVLQQYSAEQEPDSRFLSVKIIADLLRKPRWLAGIGAMIAGQLLQAWAITWNCPWWSRC
jgi:hypothetical protein